MRHSIIWTTTTRIAMNSKLSIADIISKGRKRETKNQNNTMLKRNSKRSLEKIGHKKHNDRKKLDMLRKRQDLKNLQKQRKPKEKLREKQDSKNTMTVKNFRQDREKDRTKKGKRFGMKKPYNMINSASHIIAPSQIQMFQWIMET